MDESGRPDSYFADNPSLNSSPNFSSPLEKRMGSSSPSSQWQMQEGPTSPGLQSNDPRPQLHTFPFIPQLDLEKMVAESGVPVSTLRMWEYRYNIPPSRFGNNNNKMYSWRDVAAVLWLRKQVVAGLSVRQAMIELAELESAYMFGRGSNQPVLSLPPLHDLSDFHDPLLRAISSKNEQGVEQLLFDAFATHPAQSVCLQLLQPVLQKLIELRQQGTLPLEIEIFAVQVTQAQAGYLIEAGMLPRDAQRMLTVLPLQAARAVDMMHNMRQDSGHDFGPLETQLLEAFLRMNEMDAQRLLDQAFLNNSVEDVCMNLLQAVLYRIGILWERKQISTIIEHFASSIIRTKLSTLFQSTPDVGQGPLILVGCAPKETHEMGAQMLALFWRRAGFRITYLGQMVQTKGLLTEIHSLQPGVVCLSAMTRPRVRDLAEAARAIARLPAPRPTFCFGGGAFGRNANLVRKIEGVYLGGNATVATERLRELVQSLKL